MNRSNLSTWMANAAAATLASAPTTRAADLSQAETLPLAAQMYTLRDSGSLDDQFALVAKAGLSAVELVGTHGQTADTMNALLEAHGLAVVSAHVGLDALRTDLGAVMAFNRAIGNQTLTLPYLSGDARPADAPGWTRLGEELEALAGELERQGFRLAYHNHDFELTSFSGETGLELLFEAAPSLLAELDVGWISRAGHDPAALLSRFEGRVFAIHAKDNTSRVTAIPEGGWAAVGRGEIDWMAVLPAARAAGIQWYIIEHDNPRDAGETLVESAYFLRRALPETGAR